MSCEKIDTLLSKTNQNLFSNWRSRLERSNFLRDFIAKTELKSVLNLGSGGERALRTPFSVNQVDVDFQGDVDLELDLDKIKKLPFKDNEFEMVCAMDVLEHLENFHLIFDEMARCSSKYLIISLPNSAAEIPLVAFKPYKLRSLEWQGYFSKYYGLPLKRELDRHRYWLYPQDIIRFFEEQGKRLNFDTSYILPSLGFKQKLLRSIVGKRLFYTFFLSHLCIILEKKGR